MLRQTNEKFIWTKHARLKMRYYCLSESRIKRVIRFPARMEEGILEGAVACMRPAGAKRYSEIWVMYVTVKSKIKDQKSKIKIITAWRYPGKAHERNPIPPEILKEIRALL